jgi:tetratricopeptide (TPR) repeat protein
LLAAEREGQETSGLEIAWHCMRSGRVEEGTPYLFRGAREAMLSGAVHEAELGLTTATRNLTEPARSEAYLLLAEVLQEQERLQESLEALGNCVVNGDGDASDLARVLACSASVLHPTATADRRSQAQDLLDLLQGSLATRTRVRAAVAAARAIADLRSRELAAELLGVLNGFQEPASPEDRAPFLLAKAMALYIARDSKASIDCISQAADSLVAVGAGNSVIASLECGLGANYCALGAYAEAIPHLVSAYELSSRLGNYHFACQAAANAALCYGRLGDYAMQLFWSARGEPHAPDSSEGDKMLMEYTAAHANAMQGLDREALKFTQDAVALESSYPWLRQAWRLRRADICRLVGKEKDAFREGELATVAEGMVLHSESFAGPFARWIALIGVTQPESAVFREKLLELAEGVDNLDAIDQVEVLAAAAYLAFHLGLAWETYQQGMNARLKTLPRAVEDQLGRLGILLQGSTPGRAEPGRHSRESRKRELPGDSRPPRSTPSPAHSA